MKILVTGGRGQLGRSITRRATGHVVIAPDVGELDICDEAAVLRHLEAESPELVINAAAFTGVDRMETERERAFAINAGGAGAVARACAARGVRMLQVSTDYVFDGSSDRPYREDDPRAPINVYGASKAAGEVAVLEAGGIVVRTSWLFAAGGPSFVHAIARAAMDHPTLRVVDDQHGCPTWAEDLADALIALGLCARLDPIYHYCGDGPTTWHRFATAIVEQVRLWRALACERIDAISTVEYPTPARRPPSSILDTSRIRALGIAPQPWTIGLHAVIAEDFG
ncbi:MAG: dTDP-4-dehydrorhamnose reductase [Kofleriaceae bacterium]